MAPGAGARQARRVNLATHQQPDLHPAPPALRRPMRETVCSVCPPTAGPAARRYGNTLLDAMPLAARLRWQPHLQSMALARGQVLSEAGSTPLFAVFPVTAVVSMLYITREGASSEVAVIGRDGLLGMPLLMGGDNTSSRAVVQTVGSAWRLPAALLKEETRCAGPALHLLLRQVQVLAGQVAQAAACNRHHAIEQQLCRRLLVGLDCRGGTELMLTHEAAAQLVGVRREGITAAALKLQRAGIIRYRRGRIEVLDRPRLEQRSCECYGSAREEQERLHPWLAGARAAAVAPARRPSGAR
jgi:CRP-like cAMP-binding protein